MLNVVGEKKLHYNKLKKGQNRTSPALSYTLFWLCWRLYFLWHVIEWLCNTFLRYNRENSVCNLYVLGTHVKDRVHTEKMRVTIGIFKNYSMTLIGYELIIKCEWNYYFHGIFYFSVMLWVLTKLLLRFFKCKRTRVIVTSYRQSIKTKIITRYVQRFTTKAKWNFKTKQFAEPGLNIYSRYRNNFQSKKRSRVRDAKSLRQEFKCVWVPAYRQAKTFCTVFSSVLFH